jgi:hypothetical protein
MTDAERHYNENKARALRYWNRLNGFSEPPSCMRKVTPRFVVGETVIFAVPFYLDDVQWNGMRVVIAGNNGYKRGDVHGRGRVDKDCDYLCAVFRDGKQLGQFCAQDWQLRKLNPPAEPASLKRSEIR